MSSGVLVVTLVGAVIVLGIGAQAVARHVQRYGVDSRRPGMLIETTRRHTSSVRPAEFDYLVGLVAESLASDAVARSKLDPLLAELAASAPGGTDRRGASVGESGRSSRRSLQRQLTAQLDELEEAWGLG